MMKVLRVNNFYTDENTYIVFDENEKSCCVIDPGNAVPKIKAAASGMSIDYVLITHCHYDHVEFLEELRKETGAKLVCGETAAVNLNNTGVNLTKSGLGREIEFKAPEIILKDGEEKEIAGLKVKCIATPGHTSCSVCYLINNKTLFAGDTLFLRNCGRWDLPTGSEEQLVNSIKNKIYTLDENITVYTGHGNKTSVGYEKKYNLFVK